jgi:iron donor protein CyaY
MMDEQEFRTQSDLALTALYNALANASDEHDFDTDMNNGALAVEFEDPPAKFVISPNAPVRQIWVSAHSRSFKLDWDPARSAFVMPASGQTLKELIEQQIELRTGSKIAL